MTRTRSPSRQRRWPRSTSPVGSSTRSATASRSSRSNPTTATRRRSARSGRPGRRTIPPVEGEQLELLEPLTRWLVERGRALTAVELGDRAARSWRGLRAQRHPPVLVVRRRADAGARDDPAPDRLVRPARMASATSPSRCSTRRGRASRTSAGCPRSTLPVLHDGCRPPDGRAADRAAGARGRAARDRRAARAAAAVAGAASAGMVTPVSARGRSPAVVDQRDGRREVGRRRCR